MAGKNNASPKFSIFINNKFVGERYEKVEEGQYGVYADNIYIGLVFKNVRGWSGYPVYVPSHTGPVHGFNTKIDATAFILQYCGLLKVV